MHLVIYFLTLQIQIFFLRENYYYREPMQSNLIQVSYENPRYSNAHIEHRDHSPVANHPREYINLQRYPMQLLSKIYCLQQTPQLFALSLLNYPTDLLNVQFLICGINNYNHWEK